MTNMASEPVFQWPSPREFSAEQKKRICIAYLALGNSVEALCEMIIEGGWDGYDDYFNDLQGDLQKAREDAPESFETTTDQELGFLLETYEEHEYEANLPIWG
jgi:hypothetical protein